MASVRIYKHMLKRVAKHFGKDLNFVSTLPFLSTILLDEIQLLMVEIVAK